MKRKIIAMLLFLLLIGGTGGCGKGASAPAPQEDGGGTGYDAAQKSILTQEDLYFLRPALARDVVEERLGSAQEYMIADGSTYTYSLNGGERLVLTYGNKDTLETAVYTDAKGKKQDFFSYLTSLGVLTGYRGNGAEAKPDQPVDEPEEQAPQQEQLQEQIEDANYFATRTYRYDLAKEILKKGVARDTVVAAMGKPNRYSSVDFKKNGYIIDVYVMEDGAALYLDYGYARAKLRAVQKVQGSNFSAYLGKWGAETMPQDFYRTTANVDGMILKKGATPSDIYMTSRLGEPDWYEGNQTKFIDAYQLSGGRILYLDFGSGHNSLASAYVLTAEGRRKPFMLG